MRKRLNELSKEGVVSIRRNSSLYNKTYYNVRELLTPSHNKLVSMIEAQDMIYGDYYSASIINYLRMQATKQEKVVKLSIQEIIDKLQFKASIPTIAKRIKELESNGILKATLNGRVYEYEINTELILKTLTPEVVDNLSTILANILRNYLKGIGVEETPGNKDVFSRMLLSGYDFPTIKQIIAYIGLVKTRFSEIIANATHIRTHYEELAQLSKQVSRRKANRYIYKLLNYFSNPKKRSKVVEVKPTVTSDYKLWLEIEEYIKKNIKAIKYIYRKFGYANYIELEDVLQQCKIIFYEEHKKGIALEDIKLGSKVMTYLKQYRSEDNVDSEFDENQHAELDLYENKEMAEFYNKIDTISDGNISEYLSERFKHIPTKAMKLILEKLGFYGVKYTYDELATKYGMSKASLNQYIKPYLDEVVEITGIQLKGAGNYSSNSKFRVKKI